MRLIPDHVHAYGALQRRLRQRRMEAFVRTFGVTNETRIIDIGGDTWNWQFVTVRPRLTIVNLLSPPKDLPDNVQWVIGDACRLSFPDQSFDIAYSNSVVEHLGTWDNQLAFAREARRVAHAVYVQTPNRWFPFEPHLVVPFIHYLPRAWQRPLYPYTIWALLDRPTPEAMDRQFRELRLLRRSDVRTLFPTAELITERLGGLAKSFIAQTPRAAK